MPRYVFPAEAIHADWPAYPAGHGPQQALEALGSYPSSTHFRVVDNIDQCVLLLAVEFMDRSHSKDLFSDHHHHLALWDADLGHLKCEQLVVGFFTASQLRARAVSQAKSAPPDIRDTAIAHASAFDWEAAANGESVLSLTDTAGFVVSPTGWRRLGADHPPALPPSLQERVAKLMSMELYDSAVREAAIFLEEQLRRRSRSSRYGQKLVSQYVQVMIRQAGGYGAFQRHLRSELRTFVTFVRNEFAHNLVNLEVARCYSLLHRAATILDMLEDGDDGVLSFQDIVGLKTALSQS